MQNSNLTVELLGKQNKKTHHHAAEMKSADAFVFFFPPGCALLWEPWPLAPGRWAVRAFQGRPVPFAGLSAPGRQGLPGCFGGWHRGCCAPEPVHHLALNKRGGPACLHPLPHAASPTGHLPRIRRGVPAPPRSAETLLSLDSSHILPSWKIFSSSLILFNFYYYLFMTLITFFVIIFDNSFSSPYYFLF